MGASCSGHSSPYHYGFPARNRRTVISESDSNHFNKNYLIEGTEFWSEKRYREKNYLRNGKKGRYDNCQNKSDNIYQKEQCDYYWTSSISPNNNNILTKQISQELNKQPKIINQTNSLTTQQFGQKLNNNNTKKTSLVQPYGIQSRYLPINI
ncbi:unnamed protein product [Meloidogyne enterolobii]|uniref:Uncharacterized protein n=1 Tax=Meloidogyne enterolobii TaxID=390850 RepID=A0ACB0YMP9_MELEN